MRAVSGWRAWLGLSACALAACGGKTALDVPENDAGMDDAGPLPPERPPRILAAGSSHTCVLDGRGGALCWGENGHGQLGDDTFECSSTPVHVEGLRGAVELAAVGPSSCARLSTGAVTCWGGRWLGYSSTPELTPVPVSVPGASGAVQLDMGMFANCIRDGSGHVRCWGENRAGEVGDGTFAEERPRPVGVVGLDDAIDLAVGYEHACATRRGGAVVCWGDDGLGQLGDGPTLHPRCSPAGVTGCDWPHCSPAPVQVVDLLRPQALDAGGTYEALGGRGGYTCAIRADGTVVCWGLGTDGQLGLGHPPSQMASCGSDRIADSPEPVEGLTDAVEVSVGEGHACARRATGQVVCWGHNAWGQLGDGVAAHEACGPIREDCAFGPVPVAGLSDAVAIAAGDEHSCAVRSTGAVVCWGRNTFGELGDGTVVDSNTPVEVRLP